jgi:hypothetical protein
MATLAVCLRRRTAQEVPLRVVEDLPSHSTPLVEPGQRTTDGAFGRVGAAEDGALAAFPLVEEGRPVVAVILEDGSVRTAKGRWSGGDWSNGSVSGPGWVLWWDRRAFPKAAS